MIGKIRCAPASGSRRKSSPPARAASRVRSINAPIWETSKTMVEPSSSSWSSRGWLHPATQREHLDQVCERDVSTGWKRHPARQIPLVNAAALG
jgi:hypothetical protein